LLDVTRAVVLIACGNVCFADGHIEFIPRPSSASPYTWVP
jgi:hypothetical protein